jgi:hypothetical protein
MNIYVVFFGGFRSHQQDMDQWTSSAQKQRGDVTFDAYPYPQDVDSSEAHAVEGFSKKFDGLIKKIQDFGPDTLYIAGHSSGCAIANELFSRFKGSHSQIILVDLDGFPPSRDQEKSPPNPKQTRTVQAWHAIGAGGIGQSKNCPGNCPRLTKYIFHAPFATNRWSLHFSLVNSAATDDVKEKTYEKMGYAGCVANLCWLT